MNKSLLTEEQVCLDDTCHVERLGRMGAVKEIDVSEVCGGRLA